MGKSQEPKGKRDSINSLVFELRYKPDPTLVDRRGTLVRDLSKCLDLPRWLIDTNKVEISSDDKREMVIVSFKNLWYNILDAETPKAFQEKARKLLEIVAKKYSAFEDATAEFVGIRSTFCTEFAGTLESLVTRFESRCVNITPAVRAIIDGTLVDIGAPMNFKDSLGDFNIKSGPMGENQIREFFPKHTVVPDVGFFLDIDYLLRRDDKIDVKRLCDRIQKCSDAAWGKNREFAELILGRGE